MTDYSDVFNKSDHRDSLPQRVHGFLRVCELACTWYDWQDEHHDTMKAHFCSGVVDYWWGDDLDNPSFDQLFYRPLDQEEPWSGWPSRKRFAYQQGAIVGHRLKEKYQ